MSWLEHVLSQMAMQRASSNGGLQAPAASAGPPAAAAGTPASSGPGGFGVPDPADVPQDPFSQFFRNAVAYGQRTGQPDPLTQRPGAQLQTNDGAQGLMRVAALTSHGPRQGLAHQTFDLGNGLKANVYYDANGRRKTFVFRSGPAQK